MASQTHRPRRSCLYMPGANERALEKARTLPADTLLLDLEDAVAPDAKLTAREAILSAVKQGGYGYREIVIRMNGLGTEWGADDLKMAASSGAKAVLAPKVESAADIHALDKALTDAGAPADFGLWVMIEMPKAILHIEEIAATAAERQVAATR